MVPTQSIGLSQLLDAPEKTVYGPLDLGSDGECLGPKAFARQLTPSRPMYLRQFVGSSDFAYRQLALAAGTKSTHVVGSLGLVSSPIACRPHFDYNTSLFGEQIAASNRRAIEEYRDATGGQLSDSEVTAAKDNCVKAVALANRVLGSSAVATQRKPVFIPVWNEQAIVIEVHTTSAVDVNGVVKQEERLEAWVDDDTQRI